ncbi:MAG: SDR family oxidoreductase [Firmicutes bacterium]|nr:SDR family oxidoreductase [Bacillota bacterium]
MSPGATTIFDVSGKSILLTGGTQGIGYGLARALALAGARVVITGRRRDRVDAAVGRMAAEGLAVRGYAADVSDEAAVEWVVGSAWEAEGGVDALINNAAVRVNKPAVEVTAREWDWLMGINLKGVFLMSRAVARRMMDRRKGKIVNISSVFADMAARERAPYCASKAAVSQLTRALALEWAEYGIRVNAVAPGYIQTPENAGQVKPGVVANIPMGRLGTPEDLVGVTVFLASEASDYLTGQTIVVDGGWSI